MSKEIKISCSIQDRVSIDDLVPTQKNLKSLSKENFEKLRKSIIKNGFFFPIGIWDHDGVLKLLDGHQRLLTLKELRNEGYIIPLVPVFRVYASDEKQAREMLLHSVSQYGQVEKQGLYELMIEWDMKIDDLGSFELPISSLDIQSFDLEFFKDNKIEPGCDEDETPELPTESKVKRGDIFILGNHRLMCGDSTMIDDVEKLMNGEKADLWLSDPPYGVDIKNTAIERYKNTGLVGTQANHEEIANDVSDKAGWGEFLRKTFTNAHIACTDKASHYVFTPQGSDKMMMMMMMMQESGWNIRHELIWRKNRFILGRSDYHYQHEPILYGWKINGIHEWHGGRDKSSIFDDEVSKNDLHPTMKPVELLMSITKNSTRSGYRILDLFGGSGSTLIACEKTDSKCFMMELSEHYCAVILDRWEKYSGKKAIHENGTSWESIKSS